MPSKYYKKRSYRKKRIYRKKKGLAKFVRKVAKREIHRNIENKQVCTQNDSLTLSSSLNQQGIDLLANMAQGASQSVNTTDGQVNQHMVGLQVRLKYLEITGTFLNHITNGGSIIRLLIAFDKQASNNTPLVLYTGSTNFDNLVLQTDQIASPHNGVGAKRYKVLYDRFHYISSPDTEWKRIRIRIPLKNTLIQYYPTLSSFYELNKRLQMWCIATNGGLSDETNPTFQYFTRVVYEDA